MVVEERNEVWKLPKVHRFCASRFPHVETMAAADVELPTQENLNGEV